MAKRGRHNSLTDVCGILVGHYTDTVAMSGVTAVVCHEGAVAGVDVRGSAPGTRETDVLDPLNLVEKVQAVVLSGGSVYGLAASDGVVRWLAEKGSGLSAGGGQLVPIVPAAHLYDLGRGKDPVPSIHADWGREACQEATENAIPMGCVGAGTGALSGGIKGGVGTASVVLDSGFTVAAIAAVNSLGSTVNAATGCLWERGLELAGEFGNQGGRSVCLPAPPQPQPVGNTTLGAVATDAALTKVQASKIAQMAHDGMARAIRPCHTMFDGDTIFCLSTGRKELDNTPAFLGVPYAPTINSIGHAAADCMSRAIIHGILAARSMAGMTAFCDLEDR